MSRLFLQFVKQAGHSLCIYIVCVGICIIYIKLNAS